MVGPNEILRVIARFEDYKGKYAYHCHILEHEDHEMMRQFQTVRAATPSSTRPRSATTGTRRSRRLRHGCEIEEYVELQRYRHGTGSVAGSTDRTGELIRDGQPERADSGSGRPGRGGGDQRQRQPAGSGRHGHGDGDRVVTTGDITDVSVTDGGLSDVLELNVQAERLWWGSVGAATGYDVVRGGLLDLAATGGDFSDPLVTEACLADNQATTLFDGIGDPLPGAGYWFVVRDSAGSYDTGSPSQTGSRDAGIGASGNGCP